MDNRFEQRRLIPKDVRQWLMDRIENALRSREGACGPTDETNHQSYKFLAFSKVSYLKTISFTSKQHIVKSLSNRPLATCKYETRKLQNTQRRSGLHFTNGSPVRMQSRTTTILMKKWTGLREDSEVH